jgi:hypothetical protein
MDFNSACNIAYPLSSAINNHLREEDAQELLAESIREKSAEYVADDAGLNTLESEFPNLVDISLRNLLKAVLAKNAEDMEVARIDVLAAYRTSAYKLAAKELKRERDEAIEDAAVSAYEHRQELCE